MPRLPQRYRMQTTRRERAIVSMQSSSWVNEKTRGKIHMGAWVLIEGKMKQRRWETPEGQLRTKVKVIADSIEHLRTYR